jgi:hypothetical protein
MKFRNIYVAARSDNLSWLTVAMNDVEDTLLISTKINEKDSNTVESYTCFKMMPEEAQRLFAALGEYLYGKESMAKVNEIVGQ